MRSRIVVSSSEPMRLPCSVSAVSMGQEDNPIVIGSPVQI